MSTSTLPVDDGASTGAPADWDAAIVGGVAVFTLGCVVTQAVLAKGAIPPLIVLPVALIALVILRRRRFKIGNILLGVVAALAIVGNLPFLVDDLTHGADAPFQFVVTAAMLAGMLMTIAAVVLSARRVDGRMGLPLLGAALAVVAVTGVVVAVAASSADSDTASATDVPLVAKDIKYAPTTLTVQQGGAVAVRNRDLIRHTFNIDDHDVSVTIAAGHTKRAAIDLPPGTYRFHCDVPGHDTMKGTLVVT